jgi:gamma-glutamyltranspeptidase/glutathione hydrolase
MHKRLPHSVFPRLLALLVCIGLFYPGLALQRAAAAPRQAAVAMPDTFSADVAADILRSGGNAVDATVAAAFALAVTLPEAGNIGGGGFLVAHVNGESVFLDFREKAPLLASREMFLDDRGDFVAERALVGGLASGVPGTVHGMQEAHRRFGSLPWKALLQPAILLAREGFPVPDQLDEYRAEAMGMFRGRTNFHRYYSGMQAGLVFKQPELALTLERIAAEPEDFYRGHIARQLVAQMQAVGGLISARDLREYTSVWRKPLVAPWRGHLLVSSAPPSSGGIALAQLLTMRDAATRHFSDVGHNSARYLHLLAEIEKRVFADRGDYLGDPDFGEVPVAALTDRDYLRRRAAEINPEAMSAAGDVKPGLESVDTTHFSIVDGAGNAVALTYTQNWEFGSGVVVEGAGFLLNNQMDDFSAKPGVPNKFGVIGGDMNAIAPGKRMLSSMTPTILLRNNRPVTVLGTPGGSTIFTSIFQVILNLYDFDMSAQQAVTATRFHHQLPAARLIRYDQDRQVSAQLRERLQGYGYAVEPNSWGNLGAVQLINRTPEGALEAASDPRGRGRALVIELP